MINKTKEDRINEFKTIFSHPIFERSFSLDITERLETMGFFTAPASTRFHGNYEGGLYDHSKEVMEKLAQMTGCLNLNWKRLASPYIVGMFHDLCKCDEYEPIVDPTDGSKGFRHKNTVLTGHGEKSVMLLSELMQLTEEEVFCIRYHMGAYKTDDWDGYGKAIEKYETVLWTHTADMFASRVVGT